MVRPAPNSSRIRPTRRGSLPLLAAAVAWSVSASECSRGRPATTPTAGGTTADSARAARDAREVVGPIEVVIENRGTYEVAVYAVRGSIRRRLANVSPVSQVTAVLPTTFTDDRGGVAFYARPLAGNSSFTSNQVYPQAGERLVLTLQSRIIESTLSVR